MRRMPSGLHMPIPIRPAIPMRRKHGAVCILPPGDHRKNRTTLSHGSHVQHNHIDTMLLRRILLPSWRKNHLPDWHILRPQSELDIRIRSLLCHGLPAGTRVLLRQRGYQRPEVSRGLRVPQLQRDRGLPRRNVLSTWIYRAHYLRQRILQRKHNSPMPTMPEQLLLPTADDRAHPMPQQPGVSRGLRSPAVPTRLLLPERNSDSAVPTIPTLSDQRHRTHKLFSGAMVRRSGGAMHNMRRPLLLPIRNHHSDPMSNRRGDMPYWKREASTMRPPQLPRRQRGGMVRCTHQ